MFVACGSALPLGVTVQRNHFLLLLFLLRQCAVRKMNVVVLMLGKLNYRPNLGHRLAMPPKHVSRKGRQPLPLHMCSVRTCADVPKHACKNENAIHVSASAGCLPAGPKRHESQLTRADQEFRIDAHRRCYNDL